MRRRPDRVAVVFEVAFRIDPDRLASAGHLWLVDTPANAQAAQRYWAERASPSAAQVGETLTVTTFESLGAMPEVALDRVLELIDEHHGEHAQGATVRAVLLVGVAVTDGVEATLNSWGYTQKTNVTAGVLCARVKLVEDVGRGPTEGSVAEIAMLHDASLLSIELEWASGIVTLRLRSALGRLTLVGRGVRHLEVPRAHPWGPSVSVNGAAWLPNSGGGGALQVELQTGDVVRVVCDACEVQGPSGG